MERPATDPDRRTHDISGETGEEAELALLQSVGLADSARIQPVGPKPNDDDSVNDRPEVLEEHEVPGYRAWDALDWPIITSDPKWLFDHGESRETLPGGSAPDDWLERAKRAHGVVEPGTYGVEILPRGIRPISTAKTDGVSFLIGIVGGDRDGVECRLNFLTDGPGKLQRIVRRDLLILERWAHMLGVGVTANVVELIKELGRKGECRRITIGLDRRETPNGASTSLPRRSRWEAAAMADPSTGYAFTLCKVADYGRLACKRIVGKTDGSYEKFDYDHVTRWFFAPMTVSGNTGMAALLVKLAQRREIMLVMGVPRCGLNLSRPQFRRWADTSPTKNTLVEVRRAWLAIDVDGYGVPAPWGLAEHLVDAARCVRDDALGDEFCGVECIVAATSTTGLVGDETAKLRLFFMLSEARALDDLRRWARGAQAVGLPVDPAVFQVGQPIYTARPRFEGAIADPVPEYLVAFVLPAAAGCGERMTLDVHRYDRRMREIEVRVGQVARGCGGDWRKLLTETLGGPTSFFEPLSQALGIAARSTDSDGEIVLFVEGLLAERADHGRQKQYGERWLLSTLKRFRRRDDQLAGEVARLRAGMFREAAP